MNFIYFCINKFYHRIKKLSLKFIALIVYYLLPQGYLFAQNIENVDRYFDFIAGANQISSLDGAGALGSDGINIGVGGLFAKSPDAITEDRFSQNNRTSNSVFLPRLFINKGLFYPLDVGLNFSSVDKGAGKIAGAYIKLTLFEQFRLPVVAIQNSYSELHSISQTQIASRNYALICSYGLLNYFTFYASANWQQHRASLDLNSQEAVALLDLDGPTNDFKFQKDWSTYGHSIGLKIAILPPFYSISLARSQSAQQEEYLFKLSYGL
ncbi:MAG: hypothetical protein KBD78_05665 [Oligoflexales bacterium]|nr:hypothetical protein [Oligoflexales bacterium]